MMRSETFQQTPIPIETAYVLEDAVKFKTVNGYELMRDGTKFNRYYFEYPPEWKTSNTGEMIIGVRSIWTLNKRRHLRYSIIIRKYLKEKFHEKAKELYPDEYNIPFLEFINLKISDDRIDEIVNKMDQKDVIAFPFNINSWLHVTSDLREIYKDLSRCLKNQTDFKNFLKLAARNYSEDKKDGETDEDYNKRMKQKRAEMIHTINKYPAEELIMKYDLGFWFDQSTDNSIYYGSENKDIQMDGYYENESFKEIIYSSRNNNALDPFFIDFMLDPIEESIVSKKYDSSLYDFNLIDPTETLPPSLGYPKFVKKINPDPLTEDDTFPKDFNLIFNIGDLSYQNSIDYITTFHREIKFKNIYDRNSVKIHASFANQSNNYYIGNSHVYFYPIKYYKLNSKDDKFWIEFYSGRHHDCPINIPEDEGFIIEMLFMQNQKLLYI